MKWRGLNPLPEAQLDRFLFKLDVKFPDLQELMEIMDITVTNKKVELNRVVTGEEVIEMREIIREIPMAEAVKEYALKVLLATHPELDSSPQITRKYVNVGASPRGAQAIFNTAKVRAIMEGRFNVSFEDVKAVAYPALRHRIFLNFEGVTDGITPDEVISRILEEIKVV